MSFLNPLPYFSNGVITNELKDAKGRVLNGRITDNYFLYRGRITAEGKILDEFGFCVGYIKDRRVYDAWGNYKGTI